MLWAKLPQKGGDGKPSRQRISLGIKADEPGLRDAMEEAMKLQERLSVGTFQWCDYISTKWTKDELNAPLDRYKEEFFNNPNATESNWNGAYRPYLKRLRETHEKEQIILGAELLLKVFDSYKSHPEARRKCAVVLKRLAKQEKIVMPDDWNKGGVNLTKLSKLVAHPSDDQIVEARDRITDPQWQWVFGMMATYGLRTHEVFFSDAEDLSLPSNDRNTIKIGINTKTGERLAYPLKPEWVNIFNLKDIQKPDVTPKEHLNYYSNVVARKFRQYEVGFRPYGLRHAWAIRSIHYGFSPSIAAKMMGHSVEMHTGTYHYYLRKQDSDRAFDAAIATHVTGL